jgi:hypothetical protein
VLRIWLIIFPLDSLDTVGVPHRKIPLNVIVLLRMETTLPLPQKHTYNYVLSVSARECECIYILPDCSLHDFSLTIIVSSKATVTVNTEFQRL